MFRLFRSPFGKDFHPVLLASLEEHRRSDPGGRKTSRNALGNPSYRSVDMSLFSRPGFPELVSWVESVVGASLHVGWAVVHPRGGYNVVHNHGAGRRLSTVYYVSVPEPSAAVFFCSDGRRRTHEPSEGELLVFPSSLDHGVEENMSDGLRVSVVCDFL